MNATSLVVLLTCACASIAAPINESERAVIASDPESVEPMKSTLDFTRRLETSSEVINVNTIWSEQERSTLEKSRYKPGLTVKSRKRRNTLKAGKCPVNSVKVGGVCMTCQELQTC